MIPLPETAVRTRDQLFLITLLTLATLPHAAHLETGVSGFFFTVVALRLLLLYRPRLLPGRLVLFLLTAGGVGNVLVHYPILLGKEAGVALLASMLALKLMEMKQRRDLYVLVFIGYFMLVTQFLFRDETLLVAYVFVLVAALTAVLVEANRVVPSASIMRPLGVSFSLLAQALPVMVALFLFFPRFSSPLWNLGSEVNGAVTGISDNISPGSISRLSRSSAVAFRVDFEDVVPDRSQRYWRGPVFWWTDGERWRANEEAESIAINPPESGANLSYSVTLEPTPGNWLYALELPTRIPRDARLLTDHQLIRNRPISRRMRYQATSNLDYRVDRIDQRERAGALQLPSNITPRMRALVDRWQQRNSSHAALVLAALEYFRREPFYYTLYPPPLRENPADQFLFESRRGFCEHYATSFTLLMRIAGIPARVVGGYQGGELNPLGGYLIVRQSDAHAWSEVWLEGSGWTRVDPTAAVAPERIERSLDPAGISQVTGAPIDFQAMNHRLLGSMLRRLALGADALNASWHRWVLGYSKDRQSQLMELLGLGFLHGPRLAYGMVLVAGILVSVMFILLLYRSIEPRDPVQVSYHRFCRLMGRRGIVRLPHEGPMDYAARITAQRPDLAAAVARIIRLYTGIRYGRMNSRQNRRHFRRMVNSFRP